MMYGTKMPTEPQTNPATITAATQSKIAANFTRKLMALGNLSKKVTTLLIELHG